jgi:hypothetical protein
VAGGFTHVPAPSQADAGVNVVEPAGQAAPAHGVPAAYRWQAPASHMPFVPQLDGLCTAHVPDGSGALVATFTHWPMAPVIAHDLQEAVQAVEQHTPCAQKPEPHSLASEQNAPMAFLPHELATHALGVTQSALLPQEVKQRAPLHAKGAQGSDEDATHRPVPLQVEAGV